MRTTFIALGILVTASSLSTNTATYIHAQQDVPAYAKWSKIAIIETQLLFPNADIIDYLYEGSESKADYTIEKFKLWLKDGTNEFGVFVRIKYTVKTEEIVTIEFQKTSR